LIDTYFDKLPGVKEFIDWTHEEVSCTKYVQTILGRRRWLFEAMDQEEQDEHLADALASGYRYCRCDQCEKSGTAMRQAVNSIIQGSAADIMQMAMIKMNSDEQLSECGMLFPVHDEIVYEIPDELVEEAGSRIVYNMENCGISRFSLPLTAEYGVGDSWAEAH
jgi:DNA polymerase-1